MTVGPRADPHVVPGGREGQVPDPGELPRVGERLAALVAVAEAAAGADPGEARALAGTGAQSHGRRQSSAVRWEPACGPIRSMPPSTLQEAPVTYDASGPARKAITAATSRASPGRPSGMPGRLSVCTS